MVEWLKRGAASLLLDGVLVGTLLFPAACAYLKWPLLCLYGLLSLALVMEISANSWILRIVHDPATRISHGLEHATIAVCAEHGLPVLRGFTHGTDRFVIVTEAGHEHTTKLVRTAAVTAIRRILAGEHSLAYQPGCGTSDVVAAVSLWLVYMISMVLAISIGGSAPTFVALSVLGLRIWWSARVGLGLLAQRVFTVSTAFTAATVIETQAVTKVRWLTCPAEETWFEILVQVQPAATMGGPVTPGILA